MSNWRDQILKDFTPKVARLTLVADPDCLLLEEGILEGIRERGFDLLPFEDRITFRYAYESKYRSRWDHGEHTDLVVVLRAQESQLGILPYDLLNAGRRLSFNLGEIFPNLSYPVVSALDRGDLDALYEAQKRYAHDRLGDNSTKEFILRHVFEIAPEQVKKPHDLLRILLRRHYRSRLIPPVIDERFIQIIRQSNLFEEWPLERLVADRETFFAFLQERWPIFLKKELSKTSPGAEESMGPYNLAVTGPADLPFDHDDVRVYIDTLFIEGLLQPVSLDYGETLANTWVGMGLRSDKIEARGCRQNKLLDKLTTSIPADNARHRDWFNYARAWAELGMLMNEQPETTLKATIERARGVQAQLDSAFTSWLLKRYAGLANLPPVPPVMLHHIPRYLARQVNADQTSKIAFILCDGLALDQWLVIRSVLSARQPGYLFREHEVFAWIPTLTSVSRQSAFAGKAPIYFPESLQTTDKEPNLWTQFWADQGLMPNEVVFIKGLGDGDMESVREALSQPRTRILGLVVDKVDRIMHGMELGASGMHNQVRQWAQQPYLSELFNQLLDHGFRVYLTSDHGNIEAEGCGRPSEGAVADLRGERVRIYSDTNLRNQVRERYTESIEWQPIGLPEDYLALFAPSRKAYINEKKCIVSHGGISIEEVIVPLIEIERKVHE